MDQNAKPILYLSNSEGFPGTGNKWLISRIKEALVDMGYEVWDPFCRNGQSHFLYSEGKDFSIARANIKDIMRSDVLMAMVNGTPPYDGVLVELGIAIALDRPTFVFHCNPGVAQSRTVSGAYPLDIMLFSGMPEKGWENCYYPNLESLRDEKKALFKYAKLKREER